MRKYPDFYDCFVLFTICITALLMVAATVNFDVIRETKKSQRDLNDIENRLYLIDQKIEKAMSEKNRRKAIPQQKD